MKKYGSFSFSACVLLLLLPQVMNEADFGDVWKRQNVQRPGHSKQMVISLLQIVSKLRWRRIIILFDKESYSMVREILLHQDLDILPASFLLQELNQELQSESVFKAFLQSVHQRFFPELNFILLADFKISDNCLRLVDSADKGLNRTTDFRHYSFWIQACTSVCQPPRGPHPGIHHLENVILLSPPKVQNESIDIWDLLTITNGRKFSKLRRQENKKEIEIFQNTKYGLNNRTLIVSTVEDDSFTIKTRNGYEGYCIEVLNYLASSLNFSFIIINPVDKQWGADTNGTWNGLTGQLQRREVDLVISTLSVHQDRGKVMDFLYPPFFIVYDDIGYRLTPDGVRWDMFLASFKTTVYIVLGASFFAFTVTIFTFMRYAENYYFTDMFLYSFGMLLNRGVEVTSRRQSTRLLLCTWGLFSVVIAAAYSANLVAIFAVHRQQLPFKNLGELVRQKEYKWGLASGHILEHIFMLSSNDDMKLAWRGMLEMNKSDPDVLSPHEATHMNKLMTEKYAYLTNRLDLRRFQEQDCTIKLVGENLIMHQYAIGVPTGYPLTRDIEEKLSILADSGLLDIWWQRWGTSKSEKCFQEDRVTALSLKDVASAFVLLCAGFGLAGLVLLIEKIRGL